MAALQHIPDEWLMYEVAHGRREHLETLVCRYATPLMRFVRRMVVDRHRSEELIQETFLAVWKYRSQYTSPRRFRPWLFQIAINKCREELRRKGSRIVVHLHESDGSQVAEQHVGPTEAAVATESAAIVLQAIAQLPKRQRTVLIMRFWNERPFEEIAVILGCTTGTARSHLHHALATMRRNMCPETMGAEFAKRHPMSASDLRLDTPSIAHPARHNAGTRTLGTVVRGN